MSLLRSILAMTRFLPRHPSPVSRQSTTFQLFSYHLSPINYELQPTSYQLLATSYPLSAMIYHL